MPPPLRSYTDGLCGSTLDQQRRLQQASEVIDEAATRLEIEPDELLARAESDPRAESLTAQAMIAGADAVLASKLRALAQVLANGLSDDAKVDESLLMVRIIADIEAPHVQLLARMAVHRELAAEQLLAIGSGIAQDTVLATLVRHGVVSSWDKVEDQHSTDVVQGEVFTVMTGTSTDTMWKVTGIGRALLRLLGHPHEPQSSTRSRRR